MHVYSTFVRQARLSVYLLAYLRNYTSKLTKFSPYIMLTAVLDSISPLVVRPLKLVTRTFCSCILYGYSPRSEDV